MERSDVELLEAWSAGDLDAGETLFSRYFSRIYAFFEAKVDTEARELTQRTFEACLAAIERLRERGNFRAYLYGIARLQLLRFFDELRREDRRVVRENPSVRDYGTSPSGKLANREREQVVLNAMQTLPIDHQIALELFYWEDMSVAEIAEALDVPPGTVKSRLARAKESLRTRISKMQTSSKLRAEMLAALESHTRELGKTLRER